MSKSRKETAKRITLIPAGPDMFALHIDGERVGDLLRDEAAQLVQWWLATALADIEKNAIAREWKEPTEPV